MITGRYIKTNRVLMLVGFRRVLAVDAIARKRKRLNAFFRYGLAAIFANAVNAFVYLAQGGFNLVQRFMGIAG